MRSFRDSAERCKPALHCSFKRLEQAAEKLYGYAGISLFSTFEIM
jgi:hypothetical protein